MSDREPEDRYDLSSRRKSFLGLTKESALKGLFGGNAFVSIVVLGLITFFLFKEGFGFFGQYREDLTIYRKSGLEYVELMREEQNALSALNRYLNSIRTLQSEQLTKRGLEFSEVKAVLRKDEDFFYDFEDLAFPLREHILEASEVVATARDSYEEMLDLQEHRQNLINAGRQSEANSFEIIEIDLGQMFELVKSKEGDFNAINRHLEEEIPALLERTPIYDDSDLNSRMNRFKELATLFLSEIPVYEERIVLWNREDAISIGESFTSFIFGKKWVTNSSIQD